VAGLTESGTRKTQGGGKTVCRGGVGGGGGFSPDFQRDGGEFVPVHAERKPSVGWGSPALVSEKKRKNFQNTQGS